MIEATIKGVELRLEAAEGLFSPHAVDKGTLSMLSEVAFVPGDKVFDLGCGYGVVGILAAKTIGPDKVFMADNDPAAVEAAKRNAELNGVPGVDIRLSDGFDDVTETGFTLILSHPPYHADFSVAKRFIEKGFNRLVVGGRMVMVTKRKDWYRNKLIAVFGGVRIAQVDGYFVFTAEKRSGSYANAKPKTGKNR